VVWEVEPRTAWSRCIPRPPTAGNLARRIPQTGKFLPGFTGPSQGLVRDSRPTPIVRRSPSPVSPANPKSPSTPARMPLGKRAARSSSFGAGGPARPARTNLTSSSREELQRTVSAIVWGDAASLSPLRSRMGARPLPPHPRRPLRTRDLRSSNRDGGRPDRRAGRKTPRTGSRKPDFVETVAVRFGEEFAELRALTETEIADLPLRTLVLKLLGYSHRDPQELAGPSPRVLPLPRRLARTHAFGGQKLPLAPDRYRGHYRVDSAADRDLVVAGAVLHDIGRAAELTPQLPGQPTYTPFPAGSSATWLLGRDLVHEVGVTIPDLNPELLTLLRTRRLFAPELARMGSPRLPAIPEVLILHHADDLDAKLEMYVRCLTRGFQPRPVHRPRPGPRQAPAQHRTV